jgi:hypothetical protein
MSVGSLERVAEERTDLSSENLARLQALVDSWEILADLSQADLVLWLPTWNAAGYVAAAMVRPTTAPTTVPDEIVGTFLPRGRLPEVDRARVSGLVGEIHSPEAIAVPGTDGRVIAVIARQARSHAAGLLLRPIWTPLHQLPMYQACPAGSLAVAGNQAPRLLNLPSSPQLLEGWAG